MHPSTRLLIALWILVSACWGCSGAKVNIKEIPPNLASVSPAKRYVSKIGLILTYTPPTAVGRQLGERYFQTLVEAIRDEGRRLQLVTNQDSDFPMFFTMTAQVNPSAGTITAVTREARLAGYNWWGTARIFGLRREARRSGFFWFRKLRHYAYFNLNFTIYDTITGAKVIDDVIESSAKITEDEYNAFETGGSPEFKDLTEAITDIADELGEHAVEVLSDQPWRSTVAKVEGGRIFLPAGIQSGLRPGDRLTVFEGRQTMAGKNGETFLVPGLQVGEMEIVNVTEQMAEARDLSSPENSRIQAGDFAAAVK